MEKKFISLAGLSHFLDNCKVIFASKGDIESKVDKEEGKGLSAEDFTAELKAKLDELENYDDTEVRGLIDNLKSALDEFVETEDVEGVINTFTEIKNFLNSFSDTENLASVLSTLENNIKSWTEEYVAGEDIVSTIADNMEVATNGEIEALFAEKEDTI